MINGNAKKQGFLGAGWSFPPDFDNKSGTVVMSQGADNIRESLTVLFSTNPGERVMHPKYGCDLKSFLFEAPSVSVITHLKDIISQAILHYEPRIILNDVDVDISAVLEGIIYLSLDYTVRTTNSRSNMVYPYCIHEGTLLSR